MRYICRKQIKKIPMKAKIVKFGPFLKLWIPVIGCIALSSCWPCNTTVIDNGPLPDSALIFVPYIDGQTYSFKHSNGLVIDFSATRKTHAEWSGCSECCEYEYHYEVNTTLLTSEYPVFDMFFRIDNMNAPYYHCSAAIGKYGFYIPTYNIIGNAEYEQVDSIAVDSTWYYKVFKLKADNLMFLPHDTIFVDSLYYSYNDGVIKIIMSNGENYVLQQ